MDRKKLVLVAAILVGLGTASANIVFDHSENIRFNTPTEFNDDIYLNNNIQGFPKEACPSGEAVTDINDDGSVQCNSITSTSGGSSQDLSQVLEQGSVANQTINLDGNQITMLEAISGQSADIRVDSDLNLSNNNITNIQALENFFTSSCSNGEAVTNIQDDGTVECSEIEGSASGLSEVLEMNNTANQSIEMPDGVAIGKDVNVNSENDVAIGFEAGNGNTGDSTSMVGFRAGKNNDASSLTALGFNSAWYNAGSDVTAVGFRALQNNSGKNAIGLGSKAGIDNQFDNTVSIGADSTTDAAGAVAIGYNATSNQEYTAKFGSDSQNYDVNVTGSVDTQCLGDEC